MAVEFGASFAHNLRNLGTFRGRDRPGIYWPFTLTIFLASVVVGFALTIPLMVGAFTEAFEAGQAATEGGGQMDQAALQADMTASMMAEYAQYLPIQAISAFTLVLLLTAATVRRLHDRDWSGWWVLLPIGWQLGGLALSAYTYSIIATDPTVLDPATGTGGTLQIANLALLVGAIVVLVQLVQRGNDLDNRYGPPPE